MANIPTAAFTQAIQNQNTQYESMILSLNSEYLIDSQKSMYQTVSLDNYIFANTILIILYYCIVIGIAYKLYTSVGYSRWMKITIIILLSLFPRGINTIELAIYDYFIYYYSLATGIVYVHRE